MLDDQSVVQAFVSHLKCVSVFGSAAGVVLLLEIAYPVMQLNGKRTLDIFHVTDFEDLSRSRGHHNEVRDLSQELAQPLMEAIEALLSHQALIHQL